MCQITPFTKETFPVRNEWRAWNRHPEILAGALGHRFNPADIEKQSAEYRLRPGPGPARPCASQPDIGF
jgi:hypothetical protein